MSATARLTARGLVTSLLVAACLTAETRARADDAPALHAADAAGGAAVAAHDAPADRILSPSVVATAPILLQRSAGVDVIAGVRDRSLPGVVGSEVDARVSVERRDGRLQLVAAGMLRRAVGTRDDTDAGADVTAMVSITENVRAGAEGRARGEVVDGIVASDDQGRPVELVTGAVLAATLHGVSLQALSGWCWPRGPQPSGPAVLAGAAFRF